VKQVRQCGEHRERPGIVPDIWKKMRTRKPIGFDFRVIDITGRGLSRTVTVGLLNVGNFDAHHVQLELEAFCSGRRIRLDGRDYLIENLGTLRARQWVTKTRTFGLGFSDGLRIQGTGITLKVTISSDEKTEIISHYYEL